MSQSFNQEILQDFLHEAGDLLEVLNKELVDLENHPDDMDILNKAFRAFHTIKGGAGFIGLAPLVEVCHRAEEVFSELRDGKIRVNSFLMDVLLETLDVVNEQFTAYSRGQEPQQAPPELLARLEQLLTDTGEVNKASEESSQVEDSIETPDSQAAKDPADAEFESMLNAAANQEETPSDNTGKALPDTIDDDEFEALLDELYGTGGIPGGGGNEQQGNEVSPSSLPDTVDDSDGGQEVISPPDKHEVGEPSKPPETVRVDVTRLDKIMNLVGELVLVRNRLNTYSHDQRDTLLTSIADTLDRVTADVQTAVMDSRLQPVRKVFSRFPRLVRDLARDLNKSIDLSMSGEDTELDKQILDALSEPLVHLVRNAVDHGIEPPDEREKAGKDPVGQLMLSAGYAGDRVEITVKEDGRGLDAKKILQSALEKGIVDSEDAIGVMDEREIFDLIFMPGFSTIEEISNISGRGVGMDAVKAKVSELNGRVEIESEIGVGASFTISVPLTLAILPTLMVTVSGKRYALPLSSVSEVSELDTNNIHYVNNQPVLVIRENPISIYRAAEYLGLPMEEAKSDRPEVVVVVELETRKVGVIVDEILGQEEAVMKPLGAFVRRLPGMGGGTVTGDGNIALILDIPDLLRRATPVKRRRYETFTETAEV